MRDILVVDDERSMREFLEILLGKEGWQVRTAGNVSAAQEHIEERTPELVITDLKMKGGTGLDLLRWVKTRHPDVEVIVITAFGTDQTAVEALKQGAYDYVTKPFQVDEIRVVVNRALEHQRLLRENLWMRTELTGRYDYGELVGKSPGMLEVYRLIDRVAPTRSNILITGESGTGKELVARAVHLRSSRCDKPFVPIDCAAIPEQLLEAELFGSVKGAFTGATSDRRGMFEVADGGTVLLDEIAELPQQVQVKLLRVLQERSVKRLGESRDRQVDVRVLAATNRDIDAEVEQGAFRQDLFYRLNVIRIHVPPLRDRRDDIPDLVRHFARKVAGEEDQAAPLVLSDAMEFLADYAFPGNVRELRNLVERAVALSQGRPIGAEAFAQHVRRKTPARQIVTEVFPEEGVELEEVLAAVEKRFLEQALEQAGGVKKEAARKLGISFRSMRYRLIKHGIE